jgi:t-SNARE complex subunit (syntaxin)
MSHSHNLQELAAQAEALRDSLLQTARDYEQFEFNVEGVHSCMARIQTCIRLIGNQRRVALAHRDRRKVMAELEEAVTEMAELLNLDH